LPTMCEAAGVSTSALGKIDGRSFLPQLRGESGQPRQWIYSWYSPRGEALREFAFDHHYKLYRNGEFYDLPADRAEKSPVKVASLSGDAAAAAKKLQAALDQHRDARPANLPKPAGEAQGAKAGGGKRVAKKAAKAKGID
jgi:arylsulfatase A